MKIYSTILLILFLVANFAYASGQNEDAVDYMERIQVYTDRDVYVSGENILFSAFLTNNKSERHSESNFAYLVIRDAQNRHVADLRMKLEGDRFSGRIYIPDTLKTGYYQIVSFTNYMRNHGEEFYFKKELIIANRFDERLDALNFSQAQSQQAQASSNNSIQILSEEKAFHPRDKVKINISLPPGINEKANISFVVREQQTWNYSSENADEIKIKQADFRNNMGKADDVNPYYPESKGIFISGKVIDSNANPLHGRRVMLFTPDSIVNMKFDITNESGEFSILLTEYYCGRQIVIKLEKNGDAFISMDNKFNIINDFKPSGRVLPSHLKNYIEQSQSVVKILKVFPIVLNEKAIPKNNQLNIPLVYIEPDAIVKPAEYQILDDFTEISREILPGVQIRERNGIFSSSIYNEDTRFYFSYSPAIFLDGVLIDDVSQIIGLGTEKLLRVEYIMRERFIGDMAMKGILSVFTKEGEAQNISFTTPFMDDFVFHNYPSVELFEGLSYDDPFLLKNPKPDLRQTLYWNSNLEMEPGENKSIDFYCSDLDGVYEVIINGITSSGQDFNIRSSFEVITTSR